MKNVFVLNNPLVSTKIAILRDKNTDNEKFRATLHELSNFVLYEASRELGVCKKTIQTPICECSQDVICDKILIVPILRAALGMNNAALDVFPNASVGFVGIQRNEQTLKAEFFFKKMPQDAGERTAIVIDPMFATGGSAIAAVDYLKQIGVKKIIFTCILSAKIGVEKFQSVHSDVPIYTACMDEKLNENGYIVPGLGDAGDRIFNT